MGFGEFRLSQTLPPGNPALRRLVPRRKVSDPGGHRSLLHGGDPVRPVCLDLATERPGAHEKIMAPKFEEFRKSPPNAPAHASFPRNICVLCGFEGDFWFCQAGKSRGVEPFAWPAGGGGVRVGHRPEMSSTWQVAQPCTLAALKQKAFRVE